MKLSPDGGRKLLVTVADSSSGQILDAFGDDWQSSPSRAALKPPIFAFEAASG
jgi:hypothetical protein